MQIAGKKKQHSRKHTQFASARKIMLCMCGLSAALSLAFYSAFEAANTYYARQSLVAQEQIAWN